MFGFKFFVFLIAGAVFTLAVTLFSNKLSHKIETWRLLVCFLVGIISGLFGTVLLSFVESGSFGGKSYFGAVFLPLITIPLISKLLKVAPEQVLDIAAPGECATLTVMKVHCYIEGCCGGRDFINPFNGNIYTFPSQIVESVNGFLILLLLLYLLKTRHYDSKIYPIYMVVYGGTRFFLNFFRNQDVLFGIFAISSVWALVSVILGLIMIARINQKNKPKVVHKKK